MRRLSRLTLAVCAWSVCSAAAAGALMQPSPAPEWQTSAWLNHDPGMLTQLRGKVVLVEFFQLWCPGCNAFSIPLFKRWNELYGDNPQVEIVSIHSVFEGHSFQTRERLESFIEEKGIRHAVGIDSYSSATAKVPISMQRFKAEGTPHVIIIDKQGQIQFSHFGRFNPGPVEGFIERLLKEKTGSRSKKKSKKRR